MKDTNLFDSQESRWVELARKNDLEAFNQLVLAYQDTAFSLATWLLNDQACAEDIVQAAFVVAYSNINHFRGGSFRAWLLKIVRNSCIDELRRRKRHPLSTLDLKGLDAQEMEYADWCIDPGLSPEDLLIQQEGWKKIEQTIQRLANPLREVLVLVDIEAFNYQEAARLLNIPLGTVKSRLGRARACLRGLLVEESVRPKTSDSSYIGADLVYGKQKTDSVI